MLTIKDILQENQPELLNILMTYCNKAKSQSGLKVNDSLARELMKHDTYYRGKGGAIKQKY